MYPYYIFRPNITIKITKDPIAIKYSVLNLNVSCLDTIVLFIYLVATNANVPTRTIHNTIKITRLDCIL
jgi:hypothetical protein